MKRDSIVFITGSKSSLPFINEAKNKGYKAIVIDNDPECVGKKAADHFAIFSAANKKSIVNYLDGISNEFKINGVLTYSSLSFALETVSYIAKKFNLPFFSKESVQITYDKNALHKALIKSNCNVPKTYRNLSELTLEGSEPILPIVKKLKSGIGSFGTTIHNSIEELKENLTKSEDDFVLQDFIDGPLLHIDGYIQNGKPNFLTFFQKLTNEFNSIPLTKGFIHGDNALKNHHNFKVLVESIINFIKQTGMDNNFFGADFIYSKTDNNFYILEIGYLMDVKVDRLLFHSGINPYSLLIDICLGNNVSIDAEDINNSLVLEFIYPTKTGVFNKIESTDIKFEWERDDLDVKNLPNSVADILGWAIYNKDNFSRIPDSLMMQIQGKDS